MPPPTPNVAVTDVDGRFDAGSGLFAAKSASSTFILTLPPPPRFSQLSYIRVKTKISANRH
jgi:hypothetical protein